MDHVRGTRFGWGADVVSVPVGEHRPVVEPGAFAQVFDKKGQQSQSWGAF
jgi:hypothetical protein